MVSNTLVMGVLNVTPDSFSDGGLWQTTEVAITHGRQLANQGASIIDIGGESTRPGANRVSVAEELSRVLPVVESLVADGITVSVDTMRAEVASKAIEYGAKIINDVSGGKADPKMFEVVAQAEVDYVLMHWRGHSQLMQTLTEYNDVVEDVIDEMIGQRDLAVKAGIDPQKIILDPGIGFAKTPEQNWVLLRNLAKFNRLGHRVLIGVSRKRFIGEILLGRDPLGRDVATSALSFWCGLHDIWAVRTHEIPNQIDVLAVADKLK